MDATQFDTLLRGLTSARPRRGAVVGLLGGALGLFVLSESEAKHHKKRKKKPGGGSPPVPPPPSPPSPPAGCTPTCTGVACGAPDGCGGVCQAGSALATRPASRACALMTVARHVRVTRSA